LASLFGEGFGKGFEKGRPNIVGYQNWVWQKKLRTGNIIRFKGFWLFPFLVLLKDFFSGAELEAPGG